jgi:hypothetical protein
MDSTYLSGCVRLEAQDDKDEDGDGVEEEASPQRYGILGGVADGAHDQQEDGAGRDDARRKQHQLIHNVQHRDILRNGKSYGV